MIPFCGQGNYNNCNVYTLIGMSTVPGQERSGRMWRRWRGPSTDSDDNRLCGHVVVGGCVGSRSSPGRGQDPALDTHSRHPGAAPGGTSSSIRRDLLLLVFGTCTGLGATSITATSPSCSFCSEILSYSSSPGRAWSVVVILLFVCQWGNSELLEFGGERIQVFLHFSLPRLQRSGGGGYFALNLFDLARHVLGKRNIRDIWLRLLWLIEWPRDTVVGLVTANSMKGPRNKFLQFLWKRIGTETLILLIYVSRWQW